MMLIRSLCLMISTPYIISSQGVIELQTPSRQGLQTHTPRPFRSGKPSRLPPSFRPVCPILTPPFFPSSDLLTPYAVGHNPNIWKPEPTTDPVSVHSPCHQPNTKPKGSILTTKSMGTISMPRFSSCTAFGRAVTVLKEGWRG